MACTAKDLILDIKALKKKAIEKGIVREEKPLPDINEKDCPHKLSEGWLWVRLGDYALKVTDYVASGSFASLKDNVLITNEPNYAVMIKTADFSNNFTKNLTYTDKRGYEFLSNSNLYGGELILSNIGSIGKVFIVPNLNRPMTLASNTIMIKLTDEKLVKYLYYFFLSPLGQKTLKSISSGTSMLKFNKTQLKNILIPVAPLKIQIEIVNILDNLSNIIASRKQELQKLDDLIKARFVEMLESSELSDETTIEAITEQVKVGFVGTCEKYYTDESGVPMLRTGNITEKGIDLKDLKYVTREFHEKNRKSQLHSGDLLIARHGSNGQANVYFGSEAQCLNAVVIVPNQNVASSVFLAGLINSPMVEKQIERTLVGSTQRVINTKSIANLKVRVPNLTVQIQYEDFVKQVDKSKFNPVFL